MKKPSSDLNDYPDFELMFPSKYIKGVEVKAAGRPFPLTITRLEPRHELTSTKGEVEYKPCLFFAETDKGMVLNKTNATTLGEALGRDPRKWPGKKIVPTAERWRGNKVALRVDEEATKAANRQRPGESESQPPPLDGEQS